MKEKPEIFEYPILIREHHLDTLGHINNATYLQIFEEARWEFITRNGFGLKDVHLKQVSPIILEINIKFKKEVGVREKAKVLSECFEYKGKIGKIRQSLIKENGEDACEALITFGLFDLKLRKLIPPTPEWLKAVGLDGEGE